MENIDLSSIPPWGFCPACLDRLKNGTAFNVVSLPHGKTLVHGYCEHREVGASTFIRMGIRPRWRLLTPIDAIDWESYIKITLSAYYGVLQGIQDGENQSHPPAGEPN